MTSVGEDFPREQARLLPNGAGTFGAVMIEATLTEADQALTSGDIVAILRAYQAMRDCQ